MMKSQKNRLAIEQAKHDRFVPIVPENHQLGEHLESGRALHHWEEMPTTLHCDRRDLYNRYIDTNPDKLPELPLLNWDKLIALVPPEVVMQIGISIN